MPENQTQNTQNKKEDTEQSALVNFSEELIGRSFFNKCPVAFLSPNLHEMH